MRNVVAFLGIVALAFSAARALAAEPRGPAFGSNRYATAIDRHGTVPDEDDYVAPLARGETLSVTVAAGAKSTLQPSLRLVDPDGAVLDPGATVAARGRRVVLSGYAIPKTGTWVVRVASANGEDGEYSVRFEVASPRPVRVAKQRLGGEAPMSAAHEFDAVAGSTLSLTLDGAGAPVALRSIAGPSGEEIVPSPGTVVVKGGRTTVRGLDLAGTGGHRLVVGIDAGEATYSLTLGVAPPPRPSGAVSLAPGEPALAAVGAPADVVSGALVRLHGARFVATSPPPRVWIGGRPATVLGVNWTGSVLDVVAPAGAEGEVVGVAVQNPDGQSVARDDYLRYVTLRPLDVLSIEPAAAVLQQGAGRTFKVMLTRPAPPLGLVVTLASEGDVGSLPAFVLVRGNESSASFSFIASPTPASGRIVASYEGQVAAEVTVTPPARLAAIEPSPATVLENSTHTFTLTLEAPAPPSGLDVELTVSGAVGGVPAWVHVDAGAIGTTFELAATNVRASGAVTATSENSVSAEVSVEPPETIDLSGWRIEQANSARTFTIPAGTVLREGDYLVIGRSVTRSQFEGYWGRTLGDDVVYLNGSDQWPSINGSETFHLKDAQGVSVDGPTVAMASAGGVVLHRRAGLAAGDAGSWTSSAASPVSNATPGTGQTVPANPAGVYVSEVADAVGSGNFIFEFVELRFDRLP